MAKRRNTIVREYWQLAIGNHALAEAAWELVAERPDCPARNAIGAAVKDAEENIYNFPAPTLSDTVKKLELFWGLDRHAPEGRYSPPKRRLIGDIYRLEREIAGLEEPDVSGRSPEEIEADLSSWREAVEEYHACVSMLNEGPSEKWGSYRSDDLVSLRSRAENVLLTLPASSLYGVILKFELMIDAYAGRDFPGAGSILGDLLRFARNAELAWRTTEGS